VKILGLLCSPRKQSNTGILLDEALLGSRDEGAETEVFSVSGKNIAPCDGCSACGKTGKCHIQDDMQVLYEKMLEADGIIFGTPIYFYGMTAQAKAIIDRTISLNRPERTLANIVGGVIVTGGSLGLVDGLKDLYFFMVTKQMVPANFVAAYPGPKSEIKKMEKTMKASRELGRQMVKIAAQKFKYPQDIQRASFAYGTHTN
jgi:multimeric flavodoxin WrbA